MATALAQLEQLIKDVPPETPENFQLRDRMLAKARQLMIALERPDNSIERVCFGVWEGVAIKIAVDMGLFRLLRDRSPQTVEELATATKADPVLLERVLRCLSSFDVLEQVDKRSFGVTNYTRAFSDEKHEATIQAGFGFVMPGWIATPDWLKERGYPNPTSGSDTPFTKLHNRPEGATIWELIQKSPYLESMGRLMQSYHNGHKLWLDFYPVKERLLDGAKKGGDEVTMVDVGGGLGQQSMGVNKRFSPLPGRIIVQDLPQALPSEKEPGIEYHEHDFFTPEPIKGARFYYMRWILHDWPAEACTKILKNLAAAMTPGYSKVIINEWIVPEINPATYMTTADLNMMTIGGGMERTEERHRDYIAPTGLKISGIWHPGDGVSESIIELELA